MFNRWHPQLALRYLPIVSWIKKQGLINSKILEVGSGSLGIGPYLNRPFTGVDINFFGPSWPKMKQVKGKAEKLPFPDSSFDVALSVDVLEHLPRANRPKAVAELFRVSTKAVIIAVPCGAQSQLQDRVLYQEYQAKFGKPFPFLEEHLTYGLPKMSTVISWIKAAAKSYRKDINTQEQGNRNLSLRLWLMHGWMTRSVPVNFFFRKILLLFLPILFLLARKPPHYRQIYFVKIN